MEEELESSKYTQLDEKLTQMFSRPDQYSWEAFSQSVIDWNYQANSQEHDFSEEKYNKQCGFIREEFKEVTDAIEAGNERETIKELVDLVVVSSYAMFLRGHMDYDFKPNPFFKKDMSRLYFENIVYSYPINVYNWAISKLMKIGGFEKIADGILEANWSKLPEKEEWIKACVNAYAFLDEFDGNPQLCPTQDALLCEAEDLEADGRYTGVHMEEFEYKGKTHIVLKDSNNKILKPITFKEFK